ncbi:unnamed protein product [Amoebophrya sp. A25]|nr:unnamed protein product [Amoebophrya sp. A25]|eukprot:GSA25T00011457001.1
MVCCVPGKTMTTEQGDVKVAMQPTFAEMKAIADKIAATPFVEGGDEEAIPFPSYDGVKKCAYESEAPVKDQLEAKIVAGKDLAPKMRPLGAAQTALDFVGNTPLIKLDRLKKALALPEKLELYAKCECYSAGGSVKDRIALRMIEEAEKDGRIKPGDVLIEPTSGNTGVGLCMAGAIKGYKVIITMPMKMSGEKLNMMKALGAEIYRTPTEAGWNDTNSHIALALRLQRAIPCAHILDQYKNVGNPIAHYEGTGREIAEQLEKKLDVMVLTTGTGGTLTGVSRRLKEDIPSVKVVGVDPKGSILALPENLNEEKRLQPYAVEGIGYDFIPSVLDREEGADSWVKTDDADAFKMARSIIRHEGIMVGGSCGSCMDGALKFIQDSGMTEGRICVLFSDSTRNYMSKFLDDAWMEKNNFPLEIYGGNK